jgi:hypothetical protein
MMESVMTDYQFRSILKMLKKIVKASDTKEEIERELDELLDEKPYP